MTDLERAAVAIGMQIASSDEMIDVNHARAMIAEAERRGRREGAEEMRERAAQLAHENGFGETAAAIRALPLTPEEPK